MKNSDLMFLKRTFWFWFHTGRHSCSSLLLILEACGIVASRFIYFPGMWNYFNTSTPELYEFKLFTGIDKIRSRPDHLNLHKIKSTLIHGFRLVITRTGIFNSSKRPGPPLFILKIKMPYKNGTCTPKYSITVFARASPRVQKW